MSRFALDDGHRRPVAWAANDMGDEVTLVRRISPGPSTDDGALQSPEIVELSAEDLVDDLETPTTASGLSLNATPDPAWLAAVLDGPAIFSPETERRMAKIADQLRELDLANPRGGNRCWRHWLEGQLRMRMRLSALHDASW